MTTTATPVRSYGSYIAGDLVGTAAIDRLEPAHNALVARFHQATPDVVDRAVRTARGTFNSRPWRHLRLAAAPRAELLERLATLLESDRERLALLDSQETGKPFRFACGDIDLGIGHVRQAAALARTETAESPSGIAPHYTARATREPAGVAALIVPWNFPALILLQKLPYALAAGCTVVVKPSEFSSSSALEIAQLVDEAGFPAGAVNVVTGDARAGDALVRHPDVNYISFTGSTATGTTILRAAAESRTRVGTELGGNTANVVFADANLDEAAESITFGAYANSGQSCVAGGRVIADARIADALLERITALTRKLTVGDPADPDSDLGPLIHPAHRARVHALVTAGLERGAIPVLGARLPADGPLAAGAYYPPTILTSVALDSPVFREEVFGPVLTVTSFGEEEEALALANATPYGLAHSVWTKDLDRALSAAEHLEAGTVWINTTSNGDPALPFGGVKASGSGLEGGRKGRDEFTVTKMVQICGQRRPSPFTKP